MDLDHFRVTALRDQVRGQQFGKFAFVVSDGNGHLVFGTNDPEAAKAAANRVRGFVRRGAEIFHDARGQ